jgi:hypothetical protein
MGKPQAASGGVGGPTELAGGAAATAADFQPRCPRNVAQNDTRRRPATARGLAPDSIGRIAGSTERRDRTTTVTLQTTAQNGTYACARVLQACSASGGLGHAVNRR